MNRLIESTSPYLIQHANNPVNWYPWGNEAINKARLEQKPIFLSIGYAACHWCHVMAHESFEDPEIASLMNAGFVNIKVDREERPDLDSIYMQAVTSMTGSGGWPMSVFLTPDLKPFYAGTYFPPVARYNLPSFRQVLTSISQSWIEDREKITNSGEHITQSLDNRHQNQQVESVLPANILDGAVQSLVDTYDWDGGGWGSAPKFPHAMSLDFLLSFGASRKERGLELGNLVSHNLKAISRGGMYDVVGGGFSRYSTDATWHIPHFEKMLYDNALLAKVYLHAWQLTKDPFFEIIVTETLDFISRELSHSEGGFYSSLDADSEGVEGKFYAWEYFEIEKVLGPDFELYKQAFGLLVNGNWEGKIILQRSLDDATLAARFNIERSEISNRIAKCNRKLLAIRAERIRPNTDDKILCSWNGLMISTLAQAARFLEDKKKANNYLRMATRSADFILTHLYTDGGLHRSWRDGRVINEVFLEDYASIILALIDLYQVDYNVSWFSKAVLLFNEMRRKFEDPVGGFYDVPSDSSLLIIKPKDLQDNATPSGNALACAVLLKMAALTGNPDYSSLAEKALSIAAVQTKRYPHSFSYWLSNFAVFSSPMKTLVVVRNKDDQSFKDFETLINSNLDPELVVAVTSHPPLESSPPITLDRKLLNGRTTAYYCENFTCRKPVDNVEELFQQIKK